MLNVESVWSASQRLCKALNQQNLLVHEDLETVSQTTFPKQSLTVGVLTVLLRGPLPGVSARLHLPPLIFAAIYSTWWYLPSKTPREIEILMQLLHSVREWCYFLPPRHLWSPGAPGLPPRCLPYIYRNSPIFQVKTKDMGASRPVPSTEFRGDSCYAGHFAWRCHILKIWCLLTKWLAQQESPRNSVLGTGLNAPISFFLTWNLGEFLEI